MPRLSWLFLVAFVLILLPSLGSAGNNSGQAFSTWPDTGQTKCYNNTIEIPCPAPGEPFYGQDAHYQGPARSYTDLGNGTIKDNVTGLVWEKKTNKDNFVNYDDPRDANNTYTWCDPNLDTNGGNQGTCGDHDTQDFIVQLNASNFGGYSDWRIPTIQELATLNDLGRNKGFDPIFSDGFSGRFLSSTTYLDNPADYYYSNFGAGSNSVYFLAKSSPGYVRAVRGSQLSMSNRYLDNKDGTITDTASCLQWQQDAMDINSDGIPDGMNWQQALANAEGLNYAGYNDWRLPNRNELLSLVDYSQNNISFINPIFKFTGHFWSSTSDTGIFKYMVDFYSGRDYSIESPAKYDFVRAVRSTQCMPTGVMPASIRGTIGTSNTSGTPLGMAEGATVSVSGFGTINTNNTGFYQLNNLPAGTYTVSVSKDGYLPISRSVTLIGGQIRTENFTLTQQAQAGAPQSFEFESSTGSHVIDGMPGNLTFRTGIAWNGSPGSVQFKTNGAWHTATTADLGNGTASAELTIAAPLVIDVCSELTLKVTNGEGVTTYVNLGVHFLPTGGMIPWYRDNIAWTPSGASLSYADTLSRSFDLPTKSENLKVKYGYGFGRSFKYDILGAALSGNLSGTGSFGFALPAPNPKVEILANAGVAAKGELQVSFAGCNTPKITPSWSLDFSGSGGFKAPVVLALDYVAPGTGTSLSQIPGIDSLNLQLLFKIHGGYAGKYDNFTTGNCFLGSTGVSGSLGGGPEGTVLVEVDKNLKAGIYVGGDGTFKNTICPDPTFESFTGKVYTGAFAEVYGLKSTKDVAAEITWDFTGGSPSAKVVGSPTLIPAKSGLLWQPIGTTLDQWGDANKTASTPLSAKDLQAKAATGSTESLLLENVIGLAAPSVFADSVGNRILYAHHNTSKPWYAATDIGSITGSEVAGWSTSLVTDDQAAEFHPEVTAIDYNQLLAAWTRVAGDTSSATSPDEIVPHLEVVAARYDRTAGTWSEVEPLTGNGSVDRDPKPIHFGTTSGVVWIANLGGLLTGNSTSGDSLLFRQWTGTAWSAPVVLYSAQKGIPAFTFTADASGESHVVFTVDEDGNADTVEDQELYAAATVSGVWQPAARLTTDTVEDSLPVLTAPNGIPMLVWKKDTTLQYSQLGTWNPANVYSENSLAGEAPTLDGVTMPGGAAIAYTIQHDKGIDIVAAFYDASRNLWSRPVQLTDDEHAESSLSLAYDGTELLVAYLKTQTLRSDVTVDINGQSQTIPNVPQPGRTDLYVLTHTLGMDPAATAVGTTPINPAPGQTAALAATITNLGDLVLENIPVAFYDGDPATGGTLIGETATTGTLIAGASQTVQLNWQLPQGTASHQIFVVVDRNLGIEDRNRANNSVSKLVSLPDLLLDSARSEPIAADTVALTARIRNAGVIPSGAFKVSWRQGAADGPQIATATVDTIPAGSLYDATVAWTTGTASTPNEYAQVFVTLDYAGGVTELNEDNNTGLQSVHKPYATGSLAVTLPDQAAANGVQWSADGGTTWYDSKGLVVLPAGTYTLTFSPNASWPLPTIGNVMLGGSQSVTLTSDPNRAGDVDGDGTVGLFDALAALRIATGQDVPLTGPWYGADIDNKVGIEEALRALHQASQAP